MNRKSMVVLLFALAAFAGFSGPVEARPWKPSPQAMSLDYLQIEHQKSPNNVVILWWVAPPMMENQATKDLLDEYLVLAIVDMHVDAGGTATYDLGSLQLQDGSGTPLKQIADADMAPALTGTVVTLRQMMAKMLGAMGAGMKIYAFESGSVHACTKGRLSVLYAGEAYIYDTPIPGCTTN